jgi:transcriptional regulator with XRE-family HTH domain
MNKHEIGQVLAAARKSKGWSMDVVAQKAGMGKDAINNLEKGRSAYTIDSLLRYAELLGVKVTASE